MAMDIDPSKLGPDRIAVSLVVGVAEPAGVNGAIIKFRFATGTYETWHVASTIVAHLVDCIRKTRAMGRLPDRRVRRNESRPEDPIAARFLAEQPDIVRDDWDAQHGKRQLVNLHAFSMANGMVLTGDLMKGGRPAVVLPDQVCLYLLEYLQPIKWLDLRAAETPQRPS